MKTEDDYKAEAWKKAWDNFIKKGEKETTVTFHIEEEGKKKILEFNFTINFNDS